MKYNLTRSERIRRAKQRIAHSTHRYNARPHVQQEYDGPYKVYRSDETDGERRFCQANLSASQLLRLLAIQDPRGASQWMLFHDTYTGKVYLKRRWEWEFRQTLREIPRALLDRLAAEGKLRKYGLYSQREWEYGP